MATITTDTKLVSIKTGRTVTLKVEALETLRQVAPKVYQTAKGNMYTTAKMPSISRLERYSYDGVCPTPCGCRVEPDGTCEHGVPSWMLVGGFI